MSDQIDRYEQENQFTEEDFSIEDLKASMITLSQFCLVSSSQQVIHAFHSSSRQQAFPDTQYGKTFQDGETAVTFFKQKSREQTNYIQAKDRDIFINIFNNKFGKYFRCYNNQTNSMIALFLWYTSRSSEPTLYIITESKLKKLDIQNIHHKDKALLNKIENLLSKASTIAGSSFESNELTIFDYTKF